MPTFLTQGMGFQSYNPMAPNNLMRNAAQYATEQAHIANWMNTPVQTGYDSPFLNFLTNTARVISPYAPKGQEVQKPVVVGAIRG